MSELMTITEVSKRSGVASSALRYYEERDLIASERAGSGHRRFRRPVLRRIAFIVYAQRVGLTLEEIKEELAKLPVDHAPTRRDWSRLSSKWTSRIDERIEEVRGEADPPPESVTQNIYPPFPQVSEPEPGAGTTNITYGAAIRSALAL